MNKTISCLLITLCALVSAPRVAHSASNAQKVKEFIVLGYRELTSDLKKGGGQYLFTLYDDLRVKPEEQPEALRKIRALSEAYSIIPDFADHVIEMYKDRLDKTEAITPTTSNPPTPVFKRNPTGDIDAFFQQRKVGDAVVVALKDGRVIHGVYDGYREEGASIHLRARRGLFLFMTPLEFKNIREVHADDH